MRKLIVVLMSIIIIISCSDAAPTGDRCSPEIARMIQFWDASNVEDIALMRNLVRWYNLNLESGNSDTECAKVYEYLISCTDGMIGYVSIPEQGGYIPIYLVWEPDGFVHEPHSCLPIGQYGSYSEFMLPEKVILTAGDEVKLWIFGESIAYTVERVEAGACVLFCSA